MWRTASEPYRAVVKHNTESHFASMEFIVKLLTTCQDVHFRVWDDEEWNVAEPDPADFFNVLENPGIGDKIGVRDSNEWYHSSASIEVDGELVPVNIDQKAAMEASGSNHSNKGSNGSHGDLKKHGSDTAARTANGIPIQVSALASS